ncbi:MAG: lysophospholipid acyltransferase family protein [Dissulfurispiraceae bacterium]
MEGLAYKNGSYETTPGTLCQLSTLLPSVFFYRKLLSIVFKSSAKAKRFRYDTFEWAKSSLEVLRALERVGVTIEIVGVDHFKMIEGPCIFVSNHMSALETFVLPGIIAPFKDVTFVVKKSLVDYPVFKYVMRSRDPVTVGRLKPREDLKMVLEGGTKRLLAGRSIVIFPQTTRSAFFNVKEFNTIGIKLAKKANVPVVPIALKTDAWGNGKVIKDFGRIDPSKKVHIVFGKPIWIRERGVEEHNEVTAFITNSLKEWQQ